MKAAERGDVEKVSSILAKKGVSPTKLDVEGRSAFHVVASKGNLDCLNTILVHGVDITATDAAGRNALHLAAKYGHALCLQKLLQYNCPTENVDLQGRTALHDAAMSDCSASIQLLCDHGAAVNSKDGDGRTPLVLATQMCRPAVCQLLIDRGADVNARDKQSRTALMLGCEYGCKDAVEVLLRNGADVGLTDGLGHDCAYYARIGDNIDILALIKAALEDSSRGRRNLQHFPLAGIVSLQREERELELENQDLKDRMREVQEEQRMLLDRISGLQLQLTEEQMFADDLENEKDELKKILTTKEKQQEESLRTIEALKAKLKYYESLNAVCFENPGKEDLLLKQGQALAVESQVINILPLEGTSRSMLRPLELSLPTQSPSSEKETLKKELESLRSCFGAAKEEISRLQRELALKGSECQALASECQRSKAEADGQIRQLEDALKDVQKRMFDSEGKVKQMQSHFLALKDHLSNEVASGSTKATEELKEQLREMKTKYEGASAEVGKLRNQIKQNELLVAEFQRDEGSENTGLRDTLRDQYVLATTHEEVKTALNSTLEKTNGELSDLKGKIGEIKQEFLRVNEENGALKDQVKLLQKQLKTEYISLKDHETTVNTLNKSVQELQENNAAVRAEHERGQDEISQLHAEIEAQKKELDTIQECIKSKYAPVASFEEREQSLEATVKELRAELQEQEQRRRESEEEAQRCREEKEKLQSGVVSIQRDLQQSHVLAERSRQLERLCARGMEELNLQLRVLLGKYSGQEGQEGQQDGALAQQPPAQQVEALREALARTVQELQEALSRKEERYGRETLLVRELQRELAELKEGSVPLGEHTQLKEGLQGEMAALKSSLKEKEAESQAKSEEVLGLQEELRLSQRALAELQGQQEVAVAEYSSMKSALEAQVSSMAGHLASMSHKYEQACEEALQARRSELSLKDEKELLQLRSCSIEQEIKDQKERCDKSLTTIIDLQKRIQESAKQVEAKDNKITELLNDVERLKQALNGLSQLTYTTGIPSKRHNQQVELLQSQVKTLQQQLADAKRQHQEVVSVYRTHLLSAVQGHMDEDVQAALLQIIRMRQGLVC
uniref:Uveal autoantigen with coiled-coil domains and ankyrin repeats n=1 Tax=Cyanistes caeruleus TaxID=156563 RepID=A0A8C0UEX2_CYACU